MTDLLTVQIQDDENLEAGHEVHVQDELLEGN
jgi:hypothetical protein